ncbi:MAG: HD-GYP domain-containing protein [Anaerolineales bacterium]
MISYDSSTGLSVMGRGGSFDEKGEVTVWGEQWTQFFGAKPGIDQAWVAQTDEKGVLHWVSNFPAEILQPPFPNNLLQAALVDGKVRVFQIHSDKAGSIFPLEYAGKVVCMIGLLGNNAESFILNTIDSINSLSTIIIHGLNQAERKNKELLAEYSINRLLQSSLDARNILPSILEILSDILQADTILVSSYNLSGRNIELLASLGWTESSMLNRELLPAGIEFIKNKSSIYIEDLQDSWSKQQPIHRVDKVGSRGYLALPLIGHNDPSGILEVAWKKPYKNQAKEFSFLERVAEQIAFVMERSAILQDLRQVSQSMTLGYDSLIEGLSRTLELRDFETEGHTRRVSQLTMRLVEHMKLPAEQWDFIRRGALLHDIGKLGVPDAILLKPGSLTDDERRMMEQHVVYGHTILTPIINSKQILDIVLHHHERWDGAGYPDKLKGTQIPLAARLFAVVDVFDALTSDRPYRTAWSNSHALDFIKKQAGKQFDPLVVGYFLEIAKELL